MNTAIIPIVAIVAVIVGIGIGMAFNTSESQVQQTSDLFLEKLVVAVVPQGDVKKFDAQEQMLESYFTEKIGMPVEIFYPIDDTTTLASIKSGTTHVAFMSSRPALLANEQNDGNVLVFMADLKPFKTESGDEILGTSYMSQYWTLKDRNDINTLDDMRGKSAAFSGPLSTGGYLFPVAELVHQNLLPSGDNPKDFFSNILFSGGYHQSLIALLNGKVDVAAGDDWAVFTFLTPEEQKRIKVIKDFGPVPTHSAIYNADSVDPEIIAKFEKAMIDLKVEKPELLDKALFGSTQYVPVNHYEHLQTLIDALDLTKIPHI